MRYFDLLPEELKHLNLNPVFLSLLPLVGELLIGIMGLFLVYQMWSQRKKLKAMYGPLSYQRIFWIGFAGIACIMSLSFNQFFRFPSFPSSFWASSSLNFLIITPEAQWPFLAPAIVGVRILLAILFTVLGFAMVLRSLQTFGLDYMTVIYLYFPEESKLQNHAIYSVLRHPAYTSIILIGLGGTFATATLYSVIFFAVIVLVFYIHIRFIEEKELVSRFGVSYQDYMKKVPAFFVRPAQILIFLRFLFKSPQNQ